MENMVLAHVMAVLKTNSNGIHGTVLPSFAGTLSLTAAQPDLPLNDFEDDDCIESHESDLLLRLGSIEQTLTNIGVKGWCQPRINTRPLTPEGPEGFSIDFEVTNPPPNEEAFRQEWQEDNWTTVPYYATRNLVWLANFKMGN